MKMNKEKEIDIGLLITPIYCPEELFKIARVAEEAGFTSLWYPDEKFYRDCYVGLALLASHTKEIRIGVCVTDPYFRHPIMTAAAIGSLSEISPGRIWLGFGAGGRGFEAIGIDREKPAIAIREAIEIVRRLLSGESFSYNGQVIKLNSRKLDFNPPSDIPIFIATGYGHMIQRLGGEIADGVMVANFSTPETINHVLKRVYEGMALSNRKAEDIYLMSRVDVAVHEKREVAIKAVAPAILSSIRASYPNLNYLNELPEFTLSSKLLNIISKKDYKSRVYYSNPDKIAPFIPTTLTKHMSIAGTPVEVRSQLNDIAKMNKFNEITIRAIPCGNQSIFDVIPIIKSTSRLLE